MLEQLQQSNPNRTIRSIADPSFKSYGRIIKADVDDAIRLAKETITFPLNGSNYLPDVSELDDLDSIKDLANQVYGYLDVQAGIVYGFNSVLNGIEYHQCSETIIAVTDYVLIVGHRYDLVENNYDSSLTEVFYVPARTIVECYATTLHYTPCKVTAAGFATICLLLKGTGEQLVNGPEGILKRKNKWFITHPDNLEKVAAGDYPGLTGAMIEIKI